MTFYDLPKEQRARLADDISENIHRGVRTGDLSYLLEYYSDDDTYIRKSAYIATGRLYKQEPRLRNTILKLLEKLLSSDNAKIRQTCINAAGEIGMIDFAAIEKFMREGLNDAHHSVRNAVIGSIKKMGQKNPAPTLAFAKEFLHHENKEIRREICHGIELRGRTHPQDVLPLLKELQHDKTARVRNTLVHVLGQIAYKKGCLETVIADLKTWENRALVADAVAEIIDVHDRYKNFAVKTQHEAEQYISSKLKE